MTILRNFCSRFLSNNQGSVLLITGLAIIALFAAIGIGVDLGRQELLRSRLQQSADASALAAGTLEAANQDAQKNNAYRYYALNFLTPYLGYTPLRPSVNIDTNITVAENGIMNTTLMRVAGSKTVNVTGNSTVSATPGTYQQYHLILAMDNSYSMARADAGAKTDSMEADSGTISQQTPICADYWNRLCWNNNNYPAAAGFCARTGDADQTIQCQQGTQYPPHEDGTVNGTSQSTRVNALRWSADFISAQLLNPNESTPPSDIATVSWTDSLIDSQPFMQDYDSLHQYLIHMFAKTNGATDSTVGLSKAVEFMSGVYSDCATKSVCAVVLITDGMNTANGQCDGNGHCGSCNGQDYCPQANEASLPYCSQLKDKKVLVFTIAFGGDIKGNQQAEDFLKSCATPGDAQHQYFFEAPDSDELAKAIHNILGTVQSVRIVQ